MGLILTLVPFWLAGCTLVKLKKEVNESLASTVLVGQIAAASSGKGKIVVAAYAKEHGERKVAHYTVLHEAGEYELMVPKGAHYVSAYWDLKSNLIYEEGEPAGQYGKPRLVKAPAGGVVLEINFRIPPQGAAIDLPPGFEISP